MGKDFLQTIVEHKRSEVEKAEILVSKREIAKRAESLVGILEKRPFFEVLKQVAGSRINIIAEIKRASPSKGEIRIDLDAGKLAADYEAGGAACISVLTESRYFKGGEEDFTTARNAASLGMLRKDFLISSYQVYESFLMGADAILLIARILTPEKMKAYLDLSAALGMDALVEIHSEADLDAANFAGAKLIGINNRNLSSFETDMGTATRLCAMLQEDQVAVAASGISNAADIRENLSAGIRNFLIGESLVRAEDAKALLKTLLAEGGLR